MLKNFLYAIGADRDPDKLTEALENNPIQVTPAMKETLAKYSVRTTSELRQMNSGELCDLLYFSAYIIGMFEERIEILSALFSEVAEMAEVAKPKGIVRLLGMHKVDFTGGSYIGPHERLTALKPRIAKQYDQVMSAFDEVSMESVLSIIPEKYRMSLILTQFCEYLSDGEVDSWEGCIKTFKTDVDRMQQQEKFQAIINNLQVISANTANIARNTRMTAFFAGVTAWNTR